MTLQIPAPIAGKVGTIVYPESDGKPMAENNLQYDWLTLIKDGLEVLFKDDPNVFVVGNMLWYPVEGDNQTCIAPDAMVAFGRPKGYRGTYMQWREDGIAPQVVFEILSPGNRLAEMDRKLDFYERFGVEEYYLYDPHRADFSGWLRAREDGRLHPITLLHGWVSPRLGIRFELPEDDDLVIYRPDGERFLGYTDLAGERDRERQERERAEQERDRERQERERAEQERDRERQERERAEQERDRLAARLRALGIDPEV